MNDSTKLTPELAESKLELEMKPELGPEPEPEAKTYSEHYDDLFNALERGSVEIITNGHNKAFLSFYGFDSDFDLNLEVQKQVFEFVLAQTPDTLYIRRLDDGLMVDQLELRWNPEWGFRFDHGFESSVRNLRLVKRIIDVIMLGIQRYQQSVDIFNALYFQLN